MHMLLVLRKRRALQLAGIALLIIALATPLLVASAQPSFGIAGSDFEILDGNLTVEGHLDWDNVNEARHDDKPSGSDDDSFADGAKEDSLDPAIATGSIPPNKSDLKTFGVYQEKNENGNFLHVYWIRVQDPSGTTNMDFEFNQSTTLSANGVTPVRIPGDILITYDLTKGGTVPVLSLREWNGSAWGPATDLTTSGKATGSINTVPVQDGSSTLDPRTFGEASIDLNQLFGPTVCRSFGSVYLKSRSSDSFTAVLKDFIAPVPVTVSNCGSIKIIKDAIPDDPQDFTFTGTGPNNFTSNFTLDDDADSLYSNTKHLKDLFEGTYTFSEGAVVGWDLTGIGCVYDGTTTSFPVETVNSTVKLTIEPEDNVACTFTNKKRGEIVIEKKTIGGDGKFTFTSTTLSPSPFSLQTVNNQASQTFSNLVPGTYNVAETVPTGWDLTKSTCTDGSPPSAIELGAGEKVTCTFENTRRGMITVKKIIVGDEGPVDFNFTSVTLGSFSLTASAAVPGTTTFENLVPGTYDVTETVPVGWDLTKSTCTDGSLPSAIGLGAGEKVTCTFTNTKRGEIVIEKKTTGGEGQFEFTSKTLSPSPFSLQTVNNQASQTFSNLMPGTYDVSETVPTGWDLTKSTCTDGSPPSAIEVGAGEKVTCTFENAAQGTIIIEKKVVGGDGTFHFNSTALGSFSLIASETVPGTKTFTNLLPGIYSVSETVPEGWDLTKSTCSDGSTPEEGIDLSSGETVTCTFENTKRGTIIVKKVVMGGEGEFAFKSDKLGPFNLTAAVGSPGTKSFANLVPGGYGVSETVPTGWDLIASTCNDGSEPGSIDLDPGETVTCTFTNRKRGTIIIEKKVVGGSSTFYFSSESLPETSFSLAATVSVPGTKTFANLVPGEYDVTEKPWKGWSLTNSECSDGSKLPNIYLDPGETVTCTFTNTAQGTIVVKKKVIGGDGEFYFSSDKLGSFSLAATVSVPGSKTFYWLEPGTYDVSETDPSPVWDITDVSCVSSIGDTEDAAAIELDPGETVTCTFENTKRGEIVVEKKTVGGEGTFEFTSTTLTPSPFTLATNASKTFSDLAEGTYDVAETEQTGWVITGVSCVSSIGDDESAEAIELDPGETVTCTFTNTKLGKITINKTDDAGAPLAGAVFTLWEDDDPTDGATSHDPIDDIPTGYSCTTNALGTCVISNVPLDLYWVVETVTPSGYVPADDQWVKVLAGAELSLNFENKRKFTVIVLVCQESNGKLYASSVSDGDGATKVSLSNGTLSPDQIAFLCNLGGARWEGLTTDDVTPYSYSVLIKKLGEASP